MKVVNKYIAIEMLKSTAVAVLFLLSLVLVITFARSEEHTSELQSQ